MLKVWNFIRLLYFDLCIEVTYEVVFHNSAQRVRQNFETLIKEAPDGCYITVEDQKIIVRKEFLELFQRRGFDSAGVTYDLVAELEKKHDWFILTIINYPNENIYYFFKLWRLFAGFFTIICLISFPLSAIIHKDISILKGMAIALATLIPFNFICWFYPFQIKTDMERFKRWLLKVAEQ